MAEAVGAGDAEFIDAAFLQGEGHGGRADGWVGFNFQFRVLDLGGWSGRAIPPRQQAQNRAGLGLLDTQNG